MQPSISAARPVHHQECPIHLRKFSLIRDYDISKTATAGPGADSVLVDRQLHVLSEPGHAQRPALLQAAAETTGKEDSIAVRRVRHCKEVGLQEWPLAGRATVPRVLHGIGFHLSLRRRTILSKSLRALASPSVASLTLFARSLRQNRRSSFCSGRGENLVTFARFGKPLFANMHNHVHAVASWGTAEDKRCMPAPRRLRWMASDRR